MYCDLIYSMYCHLIYSIFCAALYLLRFFLFFLLFHFIFNSTTYDYLTATVPNGNPLFVCAYIAAHLGGVSISPQRDFGASAQSAPISNG